MKKPETTPRILKYDMFCIVLLPIIQKILYRLILPEDQTPSIVFTFIFVAVNVLLLCMLFYFGKLKDENTKPWRIAYILAGIVHIIYIYLNIKGAVC